MENDPTQNVNSAQVEKSLCRPNLIHKCSGEILQCVHLFYMFQVIHLYVLKFKRYEMLSTLKSLSTHLHWFPLSTLQHPQFLQVSPEFLQVHTGAYKCILSPTSNFTNFKPLEEFKDQYKEHPYTLHLNSLHDNIVVYLLSLFIYIFS